MAQQEEISQPLSVLIVEDDEVDYITLSRSLKKLDQFEVQIERATNLCEADTLMSKTRHDVIFVDYLLVGETGLEVFDIVKQKNPAAIPILLSGIATKTIENKAEQAGALLCLNKNNISASELSAAVTETILAKSNKGHWLWSGIGL